MISFVIFAKENFKYIESFSREWVWLTQDFFELNQHNINEYGCTIENLS